MIIVSIHINNNSNYDNKKSGPPITGGSKKFSFILSASDIGGLWEEAFDRVIWKPPF